MNMRALVLVSITWLVSGCSGTKTTPAGPLGGEIATLPKGITVPANASTRTVGATTVVCNGDADHPGAEIRIVEKVADVDGKPVVVSAKVEVTKPSEALELGAPSHFGGGPTLDVPPRQLVELSIPCHRKTLRYSQSGDALVQLDDTGKVTEATPQKVL